jgi:hypothetical protein
VPVNKETEGLTITEKSCQTKRMKKKTLRKVHHRTAVRHNHPSETYLVVVRSWMLVVAFALMLGVGTVIGSYINTQLNLDTPAVAGVSTDR